MEAVTIVIGVLRVVGSHAIKKMLLKIEQQEKIAMLAISALNTISRLISKALSDDSISDEEYSQILLEFGTFTRMKEDLTIKSKTSLAKIGNIETEASVSFNRNTTTIPTWTHVRNYVQNHVQNRVQKIKNIASKNMLFLTITDPKKRDLIVNEFFKPRLDIQNFLLERVGELSTQ